MGVSPFVYGPVAVLGVLALLSSLGLGTTEIQTAGLDNATWGNVNYRTYEETTIYYDQNGRSVCYANLTFVDPSEIGTVGETPPGLGGTYASQITFFHNATGYYQLYRDQAGEDPLMISETGTTFQGTGSGFSMSLGTTLGLIAVISGICAIGVIASVKIFGFGLSDTGVNTLMKGGAYIMIWAIFSGLAMNLIVAGADVFVPMIYLALTGAYAFGALGDIGTPSSG